MLLDIQDRSCLPTALYCRGSRDRRSRVPDMGRAKEHPCGQTNEVAAEKRAVSFVQTAHATGRMRKSGQIIQDGTDIP